MPAKVILKVVGGELVGREYEFAETNTCIIGRASDCNVRLPNNEAHQLVSRHHCLLDINPPDARLRDFGSLNGTYLNGTRIGRRGKETTPEQAAREEFPEHDLKDGDGIKLGETVFRVAVKVPVMCAECGDEIPDTAKSKAERAPGMFQCDQCRKRAAHLAPTKPFSQKPRVCAKCGRDVSGEVGARRHGAYICRRCKADPRKILQLLLNRARKGEHDVQQIQGYILERELGRGGMGVVYLARHEQSGQHVALKVILPKVATNKAARSLFLREVGLTKALNHENIVRFKAAGCSKGTFFLTLEFCAGESVNKLMERRGGKLAIKEAMPIIYDVLEGLDYAHHAHIPEVLLKDGTTAEAHGLVDRDLSPHNLLLSNAGNRIVAKISDFGLSKAFDKAGLSDGTRTGAAAGKPWFMPRQQVINYKYAKPDVDVWAAAACLYNMLTGVFPKDFPRGKDPWKIALQDNPVPILKRYQTISPKLARVIDQALVEKPKIGFQSASEFKRALQGAV